MDNYLHTLKHIKEDLSFQVFQAVTNSFKDSDIGLEFIRINFEDEYRDNQTVISLGYRYSTNHTILKGDIESVVLAIEDTIKIPNLRRIQYEITPKYYLCLFEDLAVRIERDEVTLLSLNGPNEKEIPRETISHAFNMILALFNPAIQEYHNLRGQYFMRRGYEP